VSVFMIKFHRIMWCWQKTLQAPVFTLCALMVMNVSAPAQSKSIDQSQMITSKLNTLEAAESFEGNYLAAISAMSSRDTLAAAIFYREALKSDPRNVDLLERAFAASLAAGDMSDAIKMAERLVKLEPSNNIAHLALGVDDLAKVNYVNARQHFNRGGRGRGADLTATLLSAWSWVGSKNLDRARQTADRLGSEPVYAIFRDYHVGLMASVMGRFPEAEQRLRRSFEGERTTLRVVDAYARVLAAQNKMNVSRTVYEAFERALPRQPIVTDALQKIKDNKPLPLFVNSAREGAAEVLYGLASAGTRQDDSVVSLIYLRLALHVHPKHVMALVTLGDLFERLKQPEQAIAMYSQISGDSPLKSSVEVQIGLTLETLGKKEEAVAHLEAYLTRFPKDYDALMALGNIYRSRKMFDKAVETYTKAVDSIAAPDATHWSLFYYRGISFERIKQWAKAEADLKKSLSLVPDALGREKALVLNYLGYSWVDQNLNVNEAFEMLRKAVELQPRDGYIIDSLGWAFYRLGRYEDALRELEKAIELRPADPVINDHLGDVYWKVGRKLEARFQWQHAKDLNPDPEDLAKILIKLDKGLEAVEQMGAGGADKEAERSKVNGG
jgi:tetratricopeptide (TPR) repeat protein